MRFSWLVTAGVCAWFVACSSGSHKKVLTCDASECGPDQDAAAPDAEAAGAAPEPGPVPDASQGGEGGSTPEPGPDAGTPEGGAGGSSDTEVDLQIVIDGDGSVAVGDAGACLTSHCAYPTSPNTTFALQAKPGANSRFVGWTGDCTGNQAGTSITVKGPTQCVAIFAVQRAVAVTVAANGGGSVTSNPDLSCGKDGCKGEVDNHSHIALLGTPATGFLFSSWTGSPECNANSSASLNLEVTQDLSCVAHFAKQYVLTIAAQGASAQVAVTTGKCSAILCTTDAGNSASFQASPVAGFRFTGWSGNALCTGTANPLLIASVASDISCIANYAARYSATGLVAAGFTGTVLASSANVNAACASNACTLDSGTTATLLAPTINGSRLTGWSGTGCVAQNQSGNGITVTPTTGNVTCIANYAAGVSVTGTVVGATGSVSAASTSPGAACGPGACGIDAGGSVTLTAPNLLPSYRFNGWTGDTGCAGATLVVTLSNVTSSKACSANYVQQFKIASLANTGGTATAKAGGLACAGNSCTVDVGANVTLSAVPDTVNGYHFSTWTGAGCTPAASNPLVLSNLNATCTANFALNTFTIAATSGTNGSATAMRADTGALCPGGSCTVNFGVNVSLAALPVANYHFAGWAGAGCTPTATTPLTLKNLDASCAAAFAINTYAAAVTASPAAAGVVGMTCPAGNCGAVPHGQFVNFTAAANAGWSFQGWSANCGGGTASPNAVSITADTTCVASFRPRVSGTVAPAGAGSITATGTPNALCVNGDPASCVVDLSGSVTLVAKPGNNAVFTGWSGDCAGNNLSTTLTNVTVPKNCTANFYLLWAQSTGDKGIATMTHVTSLADGTIVGLGTSLPAGGKGEWLALVDLDANTGKALRSDLFADTNNNGQFTALGLATTGNQKNVIALGMHQSSSKGTQQPFLHNEAIKWDFEYKYSGGGTASNVGGEVINTTDGGYAFCIGVQDPPLPSGAPQPTAGHLTKVDAAGNVKFDVQFCGTDPKTNGCLQTFPLDVLQDPKSKTYAVLSQVLTPASAILLTFIDDTGKVVASASYADVAATIPAHFVPGVGTDTYLVVGTQSDPNGGGSTSFFAELSRAAAAPRFAVSLNASDRALERLSSVAKTPSGYALAGFIPDPQDAKLAVDAWLVLTDLDGNIKTQLAYGGPLGDAASSITAVPAGGFALGGATLSWGSGTRQMWTLRVDANGRILFDGALMPPAVRQAAVATSAPNTTLFAAPIGVAQSASSAAAVTPSVTASKAMFGQVAQTP